MRVINKPQEEVEHLNTLNNKTPHPVLSFHHYRISTDAGRSHFKNSFMRPVFKVLYDRGA